MRRSWLLGAVAFLLLQVASASAAVDEAAVAAAKQAADDFLRRAEGSASSGKVPRRSDPEIARLLDTVFNLAAAGDEPVPMARIAPVGELATNGNRVGLVYILAGTGRTDAAGADREVLLQIDRNAAAFAPEMGQFADFQLGATAALARSASAFIATATPDVLGRDRVRTGLAQMRTGFAQTVGGVLKTLTNTGVDDGWRRERLDTLDRIAGEASRFLGESEKVGVKQLAEEVASQVPAEIGARVRSFAERVAASSP